MHQCSPRCVSLIFGGTLPHYFYQHVERLVAGAGGAKRFYLFLIERLAYAPLYQALSLYFLARFEGNGHDYALANLFDLYWPLLKANWRYLSLMVYINVMYIPPMVSADVAVFAGCVCAPNNIACNLCCSCACCSAT